MLVRQCSKLWFISLVISFSFSNILLNCLARWALEKSQTLNPPFYSCSSFVYPSSVEKFSLPTCFTFSHLDLCSSFYASMYWSTNSSLSAYTLFLSIYPVSRTIEYFYGVLYDFQLKGSLPTYHLLVGSVSCKTVSLGPIQDRLRCIYE